MVFSTRKRKQRKSINLTKKKIIKNINKKEGD